MSVFLMIEDIDGGIWIKEECFGYEFSTPNFRIYEKDFEKFPGRIKSAAVLYGDKMVCGRINPTEIT